MLRCYYLSNHSQTIDSRIALLSFINLEQNTELIYPKESTTVYLYNRQVFIIKVPHCVRVGELLKISKIHCLMSLKRDF